MRKVITERKVGGITLRVVYGDITKEEADVIVNAANSHLRHGGGVAGAILRAGGWEIQRESDEYVRKHGPVPVGEVAVTSAGRLMAKYIVHAVGPVWRGGGHGEEEKLFRAVFNSLKKADELGAKTVALPAISAGIFGYPADLAVKVYLKAVEKFSRSSPKCVREVRFCLVDRKVVDAFKQAL